MRDNIEHKNNNKANNKNKNDDNGKSKQLKSKLV